MKILIVHNAYGKTSGEEVVIDNLAVLLATRGLEVLRFSRSSAAIEETRLGKIPAFFSGIHNHFSRRAFGRFLRTTRPDVVHIHNLYPLISPSILPECTAQSVPVVMTVHNFRLACPNGLLMSHGEVCHRCLGGREYWCLLRNCEQDIFKSTGYALRTAAARVLRRYYDHVDHFLCLSAFQKDLLVKEGLPADRATVLPNPVSFVAQDSGQKQETFAQVHKTRNCHSREGGNPENEMDPRQAHSGMTVGGSPTCPFGDDRWMDSQQARSGLTDEWIPASVTYRSSTTGMTISGFEQCGGYVAYVGRLSPEKDILTLIKSARKLGNVPFKFAGSYHRMPEVAKQKPENCEFLGQLDAEDLARFYRNARMVVFATRCYEGFPTVLLEAMSHGLPVVCSRIGGLPEIVDDGVTGLLYEPGNANELADRIRALWQNPVLCQKLGAAGLKKIQEQYDPGTLMDRLLGIYERVISENGERKTEVGGLRTED